LVLWQTAVANRNDPRDRTVHATCGRNAVGRFGLVESIDRIRSVLDVGSRRASVSVCGFRDALPGAAVGGDPSEDPKCNVVPGGNPLFLLAGVAAVDRWLAGSGRVAPSPIGRTRLFRRFVRPARFAPKAPQRLVRRAGSVHHVGEFAWIL